MHALMNHLTASSGLQVQAAKDPTGPRKGEYVHLASVDPSAPPGRLRLYLGSQDDVRKVFNALHGQAIQAGADYIAIEVTNDLSNSLQGNGSRGR